MLLSTEDKRIIKEKYSGLVVYSDDSLKGIIKISASYDKKTKICSLNKDGNNFLEGKFEIEVKLSQDKFPEVYEVKGILKRGLDYHIYKDGKFCITHTLFENKYKNKSFPFILETFILPFLYNQLYNIKHGEFLWEYAHGIEGTFEYIAENNLSKNDYIESLILFRKEFHKLSIQQIKNIFYSNNIMENILDKLGFSQKAKKGFMKFRIYIKQHSNLFNKI